MVGLIIAVAANFRAPAAIWIAMLVLAAVLGLIAVVKWNEGRATALQAPPPGRVAPLAQQYDTGRRLQEKLTLVGGMAASPEELQDADRDAHRAACEWAGGAWRLIREHFPAHEREFYGPGTRAFGDWGFALSCREELDQAFYGSPDNYLEAKLGLIARLLDKYDDGNRP